MRAVQRGYTLLELLVVVAAAGGLIGIGFLIYTVCHFVSKYW